MKMLFTLLGGIIIVGLIGTAVSAELLPIRDPLLQDASARLLPPGAEYLFGTDNYGRDVFSRVIFGARSALYVAIASVSLATFAGVIIGAVTGTRGGVLDGFTQRVNTAMLGFPTLVLAVVLITVVGPSPNGVLIGIAIGVFPQMVRLSHTITVSVKTEEYVRLTTSMGLKPWRIALRHIVPRIASPVLAYATGYIGIALILESALSFLGLGVPPPTPSWGGMLLEGRLYMEAAPWLAVAPGLALCTAVFAFVFVGDFIRDLLDPRNRQE
ncbi:ABC transporter permease [Dehalogenimonas sp. 4OHTPN]|uniref:ABC transporter permease n=1 Tax=Dehalogenimonas sp. 4OHTPN TaxID=3166643 RepID=A0AAU8G9B3_9CHLR